MRDFGDNLIERWIVDYGDGSDGEEVTVPHAWRQDIPISLEGPVLYRTSIDVPKVPSKLRFLGVSYAADVSIDGVHVASHRGLWDAFEVSLSGSFGYSVG